MKSALEEAHPSLYRYTPKDSLDLAYDAAVKKSATARSATDFKIIVQQYLSAIRSGHTHLTPPMTAYNPYIKTYFPFLVVVRNNRLYVFKALDAQNDTYVGKEILSINGRRASTILADVRSCLSGEGKRTVYQDYQIEKSVAFINSMNDLYGPGENYAIGMADGSGQPITKTFTAFLANSPDRSFTSYFIHAVKFPSEMRSISYLADLPSTAVLTFKSFAYKDYDVYRKFDHDAFAELKDRKIRNLVIDVRGNFGGSMFSIMDVLQYLIPRSFQVAEDSYAPVTVPTFSEAIRNNTLKEVPFVKRQEGGFSVQSKVLRPALPFSDFTFNGNVYVLIDGGTFSCASVFASCLRANRKITLVGTETGGMKAGLDTDPFSIVVLPNTKLALTLPSMYTTLAVVKINSDRGVVPDIIIQTTVDQLFAKSDPVMEKIRQLLK